MRLSLVPLMIFGLGCGAAPRPAPCSAREADSAAVRRAIEASYATYREALLRADAAAAIAIFAPDAAIFHENVTQPFRGAAAIRGFFETAFKSMKLKDAGFAILEVEAFGDTAYETGTNWMILEGPTPVRMSGKYLVIWKRQPDGSWKIFRDIGNSNGPPAGAETK